MTPLRNLKILGGALLLLVISGMIGFRLIEGWSLFEGLYMVAMTITTVGYMEVHPLSHAGRVFNLFIMIGGVGIVFLSVGFLTQALLEFEFAKLFGKRRMSRDIDRLANHYIICGAGRVGRSAARELARKPAAFVVVESDTNKADHLPQEWLVHNGDATQESVLRELHIERARGLVAATTTDATNIYIVLTARGLNAKLKIIARASEEDAGKHLRTAGADEVISPYTFAGHRIADSFLRPHVLDFLDMATGRETGLGLEIEEVFISPTSSLAGTTVENSHIRQEHGVIVLAIRKVSGMHFNPASDDRIEAGDYLIAMGQQESLRHLVASAAAK